MEDDEGGLIWHGVDGGRLLMVEDDEGRPPPFFWGSAMTMVGGGGGGGWWWGVLVGLFIRSPSVSVSFQIIERSPNSKADEVRRHVRTVAELKMVLPPETTPVGKTRTMAVMGVQEPLEVHNGGGGAEDHMFLVFCWDLLGVAKIERA
ncbi:hypothetical protein L1987_29958 [Smallanthus sonchifolius]|uniref:Uncharacterized protein n=1 Tax=Smallanthus sonchifolius TaxID=185202 RepID=A0ACB9I2R9_9ASTR|nr:hypothetical protein L1987_29958 [Smallanthus sonchifolius]